MGRITRGTATNMADKENWSPEEDEVELKQRKHHNCEKGSDTNGKVEQSKPAVRKTFLKCVPCNDKFDTMKEFLRHTKTCNSKEAPSSAPKLQHEYEWLQGMHRQAVSELTVPTSQKEFMNLWNDFNLLADHMLGTEARDPYKRMSEFVLKNRQAIIDRHLGVEFIAHGRSFHESGHITAAQWRAVLKAFTSGKFD
ncbi:hypothetical protein AAVH_04848 [Aphelenchoides avenae]|nr:hypothetical protein AAVH_04848 [Aphelenchus avenae]